MPSLCTLVLGPSTRPDILFFKRFRDNWSKLKHHEPEKTDSPCIQVSEDVKTFLSEQLALKHPRDDYFELLSIAGFMVGLDVQLTIRKPDLCSSQGSLDGQSHILIED